jgi:hypothetical protein
MGIFFINFRELKYFILNFDQLNSASPWPAQKCRAVFRFVIPGAQNKASARNENIRLSRAGRFSSPALKDKQGVQLTAMNMDTDHGFNDHRIALEIAVLRWLATLPGAPALH